MYHCRHKVIVRLKHGTRRTCPNNHKINTHLRNTVRTLEKQQRLEREDKSHLTPTDLLSASGHVGKSPCTLQSKNYYRGLLRCQGQRRRKLRTYACRKRSCAREGGNSPRQQKLPAPPLFPEFIIPVPPLRNNFVKINWIYRRRNWEALDFGRCTVQRRSLHYLYHVLWLFGGCSCQIKTRVPTNVSAKGYFFFEKGVHPPLYWFCFQPIGFCSKRFL